MPYACMHACASTVRESDSDMLMRRSCSLRRKLVFQVVLLVVQGASAPRGRRVPLSAIECRPLSCFFEPAFATLSLSPRLRDWRTNTVHCWVGRMSLHCPQYAWWLPRMTLAGLNEAWRHISCRKRCLVGGYVTQDIQEK